MTLENQNTSGMQFKIIKTELLPAYLESVPSGLQTAFAALHEAEVSTDAFSFYTSVASVFSSKIEGEEIELDSYIKHKRDKIPFLPDYTKKIDDLYDAYVFAQHHSLNEQAIAEAHKILSKHILPPKGQGKYRTQNMYVTTGDGRIEYVAATPFIVAEEMEKFYMDLEQLLSINLSIEKTFFFAAMIHLVFVKVHPWNDGNGRCARLLEKWFLMQKLGDKARFIQSERNYYKHHATYYKNLRLLGMEYEELDYSNALQFLLMLPNAVLEKGF